MILCQSFVSELGIFIFFLDGNEFLLRNDLAFYQSACTFEIGLGGFVSDACTFGWVAILQLAGRDGHEGCPLAYLHTFGHRALERNDAGYIRHNGAFIALGSLHLATRLDDLAERLRLDDFGCYTCGLGLMRSEHDFIGVGAMCMTVVVVMTFVSIMIMSFGFVVVTSVSIVVMFMRIMVMAFVFMTMPFVIVGVFFCRMVVPFVVVMMAFVAMTRIA